MDSGNLPGQQPSEFVFRSYLPSLASPAPVLANAPPPRHPTAQWAAKVTNQSAYKSFPIFKDPVSKVLSAALGRNTEIVGRRQL